MNESPLPLDNHQLFWLSITAVGGFVVVLCTLLITLRSKENLFDLITKHEYMLLRIFTVLFVIWATTGLAIVGRLNESVSAIFGAIIGYVFGSIKDSKEGDRS
ncbi:hypothetical protein ACN28E_28585 [Archangium lansingense]|uniref:hypothetical protein n=1 Tax=Archangium lansingense TaxID=2995310 RepID=UPI003B822CA6